MDHLLARRMAHLLGFQQFWMVDTLARLMVILVQMLAQKLVHLLESQKDMLVLKKDLRWVQM